MSQPVQLGGGQRPDIDVHRRRSRVRRVAARWRLFVVLGLVLAVAGAGAITTNTFGAGDRFAGLVRRVDRAINPVPQRSTRPTITVTPPPVAAATATPSPSPDPTEPAGSGDPAPSASPTPPPTPTPPPARVAVDVNLVDDPDKVFRHQVTKDWCAVAGVQMVLLMHGKAPATDAFQQELASRVREWESYDDSHDGNWGPAAMALALEAYGVPGYEIRAYDTRTGALRDAARAITETNAPAILLTWRGAHTWVMTGYTADGDPRIFPDATLEGIRILDPWYPWVSSLWGASNPPNFLTSMGEMKDNYLPWQRPEGKYPDRDGKWIAVVPTVPIGG